MCTGCEECGGITLFKGTKGDQGIQGDIGPAGLTLTTGIPITPGDYDGQLTFDPSTGIVYTWNATTNTWTAVPNSTLAGAKWFNGSATNNSIGADGDYWLITGATEPDNGKIYRKVSGVWVYQNSDLTGPQGAQGIQGTAGVDAISPTGAVILFAGATLAPTGWVICDGSLLSQITYAALYSVVGNTYNLGGEPVNTFRVPNFIEKVPIGLGSSFPTLGASGGNLTHTIGNSNLPQHTHSFSATTSSDGDHSHTYITSNSGGGSGNRADSGGADNDNNPSTSSNGAHTHTVSGTTGNGGGVSSPTAISNLQPYIVMKYIIKL